jgi:hypothetical protein
MRRVPAIATDHPGGPPTAVKDDGHLAVADGGAHLTQQIREGCDQGGVDVCGDQQQWITSEVCGLAKANNALPIQRNSELQRESDGLFLIRQAKRFSNVARDSQRQRLGMPTMSSRTILRNGPRRGIS